MPGKAHMENEKKMRREIANSNERRRMQSINAGFQSLKSLIPHSDGEKLSKVLLLIFNVEKNLYPHMTSILIFFFT